MMENNEEKHKKPRLFELWDEIANGSEEEKKEKEVEK